MNFNELNKHSNEKRKIDKQYKMGKKYFIETRSEDNENVDEIENHLTLKQFMEVSDELSPTINLTKKIKK